ncbi:nuclear transport factor 2 family protein [Sporosarcina sp. BP05]|uniref:nuclear transport factor 2 family protein n=1 Tax=Sporosarcina sp. BP05 TaxID=2758726 RepID=UPI0016443672|nr:nuclear transport factor 2 family protein [Sporosarcina sp. BP05]
MKKLFVPISMSILLLLGACSSDAEKLNGSGSVDDGEAANKNGAIDHGVDDKKVGFSLEGGAIEEASGVPVEEKERILAAFKNYIETFNKKDIDSYIDMLSDSTESFDKAEERSYMEEVFSTYDVNLQASDVTIVKYSEDETHVFANVKTAMKLLSNGLETNPKGRQVTVFAKEDGEWRLASVHQIEDKAK